jgi:glycosyltransferase involved in cell wall biosynthesis
MGGMSNNESVFKDPSQKANDALGTILNTGAVDNDEITIVDERLKEHIEAVPLAEVPAEAETIEEVVVEPQPTIAVQEARQEAQILESDAGRQYTRLLLLTSDETIIQEGSMSYGHIADLRKVFLEVHVVVLSEKRLVEKTPSQRPFDNVWIYLTESSSWWKKGYDAYHTAITQLEFSGGFRADIIVADDLFQAGLAGVFLSKKFARPLQVHVHEDFFDKEFIESQEHPSLYEWATEYILNRVTSVRTKTEFQRQAVVHMHKELEPVTELLPSYYNLEMWKDFVPTVDLHQKYPQFKFIMLHISAMNNSSHSSEVIAGASRLLRRYQTLGLVVVGNGPLRSHLERQVIALGLQTQVVFEPMPNEVLSYMKSANILLHLSENGDEDDIILSAATVKLPLVGNLNGLAGKLFVDGESACLCDPADNRCISDSINMYLNENQDRARFALTAYEIVFDRIEQDYGAYLELCRESIERSMATSS